MRFPKLNVRPQSREFIQEFGGLDRRPRISENCFSEMQNLTGDFYPALAPRKKRGIIGKDKEYNAMLAAGEKMAYVIGNKLHWGDVTMELTAGEDVKRQLVMMGAYIVVFPDAMYLNTADTADWGDFHVLMESKQHEFTFSMYRRGNENALPQAEEDLLSVADGAKCRLVGTQFVFGEKTVSIYHIPRKVKATVIDDERMDLEGIPNPNFTIEINSGESIKPFRMYEVELNGTKLGGGTDWCYAYIPYDLPIDGNDTVKVTNKETGEVIEHSFSTGDDAVCVNVNQGYWIYYDNEGGGLSDGLYKDGEKVQSVLCVKSDWFSEMSFPEGQYSASLSVKKGSSFPLFYLKGVPTGSTTFFFKDGCMWMEGYLCCTPTFTTVSKSEDFNQNYTFSVDAAILPPKMDYVIESQNRLWGCRYGANVNGKLVNEIYASALGDFQQWYSQGTLSTDSYVASVGVSGPFTGAVNYRGYPLFFKENAIFKVYGNYPENYQIVSDTAMGVQEGCDKSLFILSNTLYYRSPNGLFAYDGSSNERVDAVLGSEHYTNVVCCGTGTKLWVSMKGEDDKHSGLYVYDTEKGLWHKEDAGIARHMLRLNNDVYIADTSKRLFTVNGSKGKTESGELSFFAETGVIGYSTPDSKYVSRFALRVAVPHDGSLQIFVEYDSANVWEFKGSIEGNGMGTFTVPVVPRRCDHFRIRLVGKGDCRIFGFSKVLEEGGSV